MARRASQSSMPSKPARKSTSEIFGSVLDDWKKLNPSKQDLDEMAHFLGKNCPDWSAY